jgi:ketosteroid isomerase-like protein
MMTLEELEKRIRTLEDIEEIKKLHTHYVNCLLTVQFDDLVECFAEDGVLDIHAGKVKGKQEMLKLFRETLSAHHIGQEGEFLVHPIISVDGDRATGSWLLYNQFAQPRKLEYRPGLLALEDAPDWLQGFYEAKYVRENGVWKISYLKWRCRLISPIPPSEQS